ncbi:MAG: hypothetical protein DI595_14035 [Agrobacterium fabrum]|uniref:Uncharacterized protein n=1 Tax=Agrobacterium fabrum TaxID=1176649 RepID=A0A2W5EZ05_9HYPH|nr:MAG: hypothetical protein DI595_14035 [Agrobacterium fabrum]
MRRQCRCLPHRLLHKHVLPSCRAGAFPVCYFLEYQLKFTCVKILMDEISAAMQQEKRAK